MKKTILSRRDFLKSSALGAVAVATVPTLIVTGCSSSTTTTAPAWAGSVTIPEIRDAAPEGRPLKAGLIGCGGRGTGAALNFLAAGTGLQVTHCADIFDDKLQACLVNLEKNGVTIPPENCFVGFDGYQKVIDSDVDVILLCTPPVFRPDHFKYAIEQGKHVFLEKPAAVDPVGARSVLMTSKLADQKGLSVITGTIRRSQKDCIETFRRVSEGAIGEVVSAQVIRNNGSLWHKKRQPGWSDMEYLMRNWVNFTCVSGDMVAEQFIHEIDMMSWFMGDPRPVSALAVGGRARRLTGDVYDFYSIQYAYDNGVRTNCTSRQIDGCENELSVMVYGTKGSTNCFNTIFNPDGTVAWQYPKVEVDAADQTWAVPDPYVQELVRLVTAIRTDTPINDTPTHVQSTMMAIMARMSAGSGHRVTWDEVCASPLKLGLESYAMGPVPGLKEEVPLPGIPAADA